MRVVLVTDIHSNAVALEAVLTHAGTSGYDALWNMGDTVGYGPEPDAVITRLQNEPTTAVLGNHDAAVLGTLSTATFNPEARAAAEWTAANISEASLAYLRGLPETAIPHDVTLAHGTAADPLWEYLHTYTAAQNHFAAVTTRLSVVGHTHLPLLLRESSGGEINSTRPVDGDTLEIGEGRICINPGGVGQPRDGDPRACYALLNTEAATVTFHRVDYDVALTQTRMADAGLPPRLITRLQHGR